METLLQATRAYGPRLIASTILEAERKAAVQTEKEESRATERSVKKREIAVKWEVEVRIVAPACIIISNVLTMCKVNFSLQREK